MGISIGGSIGNLIIRILGNPENLRKPPSSGVIQELYTIHPTNNFMRNNSQNPNQTRKNKRDIRFGGSILY